jgi:histidinol-phosphate aminotransferase
MSAESILRQAIVDLPAYPSGLSLNAVRAATGLEHIAKLDSNENPLGTSPHAMAAATAALQDMFRYPDRDEVGLRAALAESLSVDSSQLVFSGGSEDVLAILYRMVLEPGDRVVTVSPGFGLHAICAQVCDALPVMIRHRKDWTYPVDELAHEMQSGARIVAVSSPSNPIGVMLTRDDIETLLNAAGPQTLVIFDEAYIEFADASWKTWLPARLQAHDGPWAVLRTFAKAYGLAGMRVGYGLVHSTAFAEHFHKTRSPFNVNAIALAAAEAAVRDEPFMRANVDRVIIERERVRALIEMAGFAVAPSNANFLFIDSGDDAVTVANALRAKGVLVKPWREPGYERFIRASIGLPQDNDMLVDALTA